MEIGSKLPSGCQTCPVSRYCLPSDLQPVEVARLESLVGRTKTYKKGSFIFEQGSDFKSIYAVRSGGVKTFSLSKDGTEQISGFYMPGELLGVEGISAGKHTNFAASMGTAAVCQVNFDELLLLSAQLPKLLQRVFRLMGQEVVRKQSLSRLLGKYTALQRASALFIELSHCQRAEFTAGLQVHLPMTKAACANYLGLTSEAYSRILSQMQDQGLISMEARLITIHQPETLIEIVPDH